MEGEKERYRDRYIDWRTLCFENGGRVQEPRSAGVSRSQKRQGSGFAPRAVRRKQTC